MIRRPVYQGLGVIFAVMALMLAPPLGAPAKAEDAPSTKKEFSDEAFLDAAYDNCATVENRSGKSCDCERKLIGDRVNTDDKQMAFLYWTDKKAFGEKFEERRKADSTWQKGFAERFSTLQALVIAACGT